MTLHRSACGRRVLNLPAKPKDAAAGTTMNLLFRAAISRGLLGFPVTPLPLLPWNSRSQSSRVTTAGAESEELV